MPAWNQLALLKKCVDSIMNQSFTEYEVWIIDGNSTDGSKEYLKLLPSQYKWISENDTGIYEAMNKGIKRSKGDWLYFLGTDDVLYDTEVFSKASKHFNSNDKVVLGSIVMNDQSNSLKTNNHRVLSSNLTRLLWFKNTVHHQGAFYHKNVFENNMYDESLKVLGDYKINLKLFIEKKSFKKIDLIIAKCGNNGISKKYNWSLYKEEIAIKSELSSFVIRPFYLVIAFLKYCYKNR
ncbi:glycosyltransferase [Dokdonia sp. Hel_I_53]|uniref:glycosyltransferase n=1 Tax=Dokdonia sp. Hel_I_53 TaxID=1566287 RepID=UPI0021BD7D9A|nr:glycosyltransferase [Dokdonia sp. Hel_I_53]